MRLNFPEWTPVDHINIWAASHLATPLPVCVKWRFEAGVVGSSPSVVSFLPFSLFFSFLFLICPAAISLLGLQLLLLRLFV